MCKQNNKSSETKQTLEEKWKNATIANNFIFYKVMHNNPDVCKELLEILPSAIIFSMSSESTSTVVGSISSSL